MIVMVHREKKYEKRGMCGICSAGCWIVATFDNNGNIVQIRPDENSSMGILCKLGEHAPEIIYSPDRLRYPLKRKGARGNYDFQRITWDDAYDIVCTKLQNLKNTYGAETTAIYTGVGSFERAFCDIFQPKDVAVSSACSVLFPFGSPNTMGVGALCYVAYGMIAPHVTMGEMLIDLFNDSENSQLLVIWGANPATDSPPVDFQRIIDAHQRGAQIVVIDPRRTWCANLDTARWIPIRPGTDGALALGLCNVVMEQELYDESFVNNWTVGFAEFSRYVQHFTPDAVAAITGIEADTIVWLAQTIAAARGVSQYMYTGLEYSSSGVQSIRAALVLWALAGQLDTPGGRCITMRKNQFPINRQGHVANPDIGPRLGGDTFPVYIKYRDEAHAASLPDSVLNGNPYKIRSLIILGGSITTAWPNASLWKQTLDALDFLVCIDRQFTADAAFADIVLPAATYFEIDSYMVYGSLFRIREKMIEPVGESRGDLYVMAELAQRLGYGHLYPQNPQQLYDHVLKGSGFTIDEVRRAGGIVSVDTEMMQYKKWEKGLLRPDGKPGFNTPSGKFEISSSILQEYGYDPLPVYTEPRESPLSRPDLSARFPLVFTSGSRRAASFHTQHHGIKSLVKEHPEPTVTINEIDAEKRGIAHGEYVAVRTPRGEITMRAYVTDRIMQGTVDANHGCGTPVGPDAWQTCNVNEITDFDQYDPISGFPVYKSLLCDVDKVTKQENSSPQITRSPSGFGEIAARVSQKSTDTHEPISIYMDHNATTPLDHDVIKAMKDCFSVFGNPSSIHQSGRNARDLIEYARKKVAQALHCTARRIVFTGCGTEGNNHAVKAAALSKKPGKNHIITSSVEHPSVLNTCRWLAKNGFDITILPVDSTGTVTPQTLKKSITKKTVLVSIMYANNITGTIEPIAELVRIAHERDVIFHCDAVQAFGKVAFNCTELDVDLLTISSHKVYGPKGVGALYIKNDLLIEPFIHGGGQEHGMRSGTENLIGIVGFGKAAEKVPFYLKKSDTIQRLRDRLEQGILSIVDGAKINGHPKNRLPNTLSVTLPGFRGESVVMILDQHGVFLSPGSACKAGSPAPTEALLAMGLSESEVHCSIRFSLGAENTETHVEKVLKTLASVIKQSKNSIAFAPCR